MRRLSWFISAAVFLLLFTAGIAGAPRPVLAAQAWTTAWMQISTSGGPSAPREIAADQQGDLYVISGSSVYEKPVSGAWKLLPTLLTPPDYTSPSPDAIAVDNNGDVFVADEFCLVEELPNGASSWTPIATGDSNSGFLLGADGIAVDGSGNVYVTEQGNVNASGTDFRNYYEVVLEDSNGTWATVHYECEYMADVVVGAGNVYWSSAENYNTPEGEDNICELPDSIYIGTGPNAPSGYGDLQPRQIGDIAVDKWGNVYAVSELVNYYGTNVPSGVMVWPAGSQAGSNSWQFLGGESLNGPIGPESPWGVAVDGSGNLYVTDSNNSIYELQAPATQLVWVSQPGNGGVGQTLSTAPKVALEDANNDLESNDNTDNVTLSLNNANGATLGGTNPVTLSGGAATFSNLTVSKVGSNYSLTATCDGLTSTSSNTFNITQASTTTSVTSSKNSSTFGQSVTFTATVTPASGSIPNNETVTFYDNGTSIGTGATSGGNGLASYTTSSLAAGSHPITATYAGDSNFSSSTGSLTGNPQVVNQASTTTTVTSSKNSSTFGQSVTFTATVTPASGSIPNNETVTFYDNGTSIGTGATSGGNGSASYTTSSLAAGSHPITATYAGDSNFSSSTGSLTGNPQVVNQASTTTTVTSSKNSSTFGQSVTFTATVTPASGSIPNNETVTFYDNGTSIGTGATSGGNGSASYTTSSLAAGSHPITATYAGDSNFSSSTGSLTGNPQVVNQASTTTTVTSSKNSSTFGQSVTFTATVTPASGSIPNNETVTFYDNGTSIGTGATSGGNGSASYTTSSLAAGSHPITATYAGDSNFSSSTGSLTGNPQVVNQASTTTTVTSSKNSSTFGQSVTFTATVTPASGSIPNNETVTFYDNGTSIGTGATSGGNGSASFTTSSLAAGSHPITATYAGDSNFSSSTGSLTGNPQVVNQASTATSLVIDDNSTGSNWVGSEVYGA